MSSGNDDGVLFETKEAKGQLARHAFMATVLINILFIWFYRAANIPAADDGGPRWCWIGMFAAEIWFGFYWVITQSGRWRIVHNHVFKHKLLHRYGDDLPSVDIFVCTADPTMEPPVMVINTVLSAMAYNYPPEKLNVYLSDDGGSEFTFYALIEAADFSKLWIPFCKKFDVEPRSPKAFFGGNCPVNDEEYGREWLSMKELYSEMRSRIESAMEMGRVPKGIRDQYAGFSEWNSEFTKKNHQSVVKIVVDGRDKNEVDADGCRLPTLVYMAREKRLHQPHNFKAGAMNALIRVSSVISNSPLILNVDCDMYPNNPDAIYEILCFFKDEVRGHQISYVQFPQAFDNITPNDLYDNALPVIHKVELPAIGGYGSALYCGTGCFHRREGLCGRKFSRDFKLLLSNTHKNTLISVTELEEAAKALADCNYENGTNWGREMGLIYGIAAEDVVTGLTVQCRGWKSVYYAPQKKGFLGVAPMTLDQALIQYTRWSGGLFQIFCSKYCPFIYGHGKIKFLAQMGYSMYLLWAPNSLPTLYYVTIPSICLLKGITLFPQVTSPWLIPFAYVFIAKTVYSMVEAYMSDCTLLSWWNAQRMWVIRRTTSFLFGFVDAVMKQLGLSETSFVITTKVTDSDSRKRYEQEVIEFGCSTFTSIIFTSAMLNLFALTGGLLLFVTEGAEALAKLAPQIVLCGLLVAINIPVYKAALNRNDKVCLPVSIVLKSIILASLAFLLPVF
uniref:Cellulose synthase-like protein E6 n=1 Tax=Kalanchoe fedtschenkoi TaxID=63787 RepID=A0A7N0U281_KALFE